MVKTLVNTGNPGIFRKLKEKIVVSLKSRTFALVITPSAHIAEHGVLMGRGRYGETTLCLSLPRARVNLQ